MTQEELKQLIKEKGLKTLINEKINKSKSIPVVKDSFGYNYYKVITQGSKALKEPDESESGILDVNVVANMAMFFDSDRDVLSKSSWQKSIKERGEGDIIPFLKDHMRSISGRIGKTVRFKDGVVDLSPYGYEGNGDALIHEAKALRVYDKNTYEQYKEGSIKQHSIGLQYIKLFLAMNDPDELEMYEVWNQNINKIINQEEAEKFGYFWFVTEIKLIENSAVLFGSNSLTPTLNVQPSDDTGKQEKRKSQFFRNLIHS